MWTHAPTMEQDLLDLWVWDSMRRFTRITIKAGKGINREPETIRRRATIWCFQWCFYRLKVLQMEPADSIFRTSIVWTIPTERICSDRRRKGMGRKVNVSSPFALGCSSIPLKRRSHTRYLDDFFPLLHNELVKLPYSIQSNIKFTPLIYTNSTDPRSPLMGWFPNGWNPITPVVGCV